MTGCKDTSPPQRSLIRQQRSTTSASTSKMQRPYRVSSSSLVMLFVWEYTTGLFTRLKAARHASNVSRLHVGQNNPHLATRRVAADLDAAINTVSMVRAAVKATPLLREALKDIQVRQNAAQKIMGMSICCVCKRVLHNLSLAVRGRYDDR